jgi:hypothetical protein
MADKSLVLRSAGEPETRAYAEITVPRTQPPPPMPEARVLIVDPQETDTLTGPPSSSGPRNPEQRVFSAPKPPSVELPDGRPIWKAQRIIIDPELLEQWEREEAARKEAARLAREAKEKKPEK